jgi:hypothetical protein
MTRAVAFGLLFRLFGFLLPLRWFLFAAPFAARVIFSSLIASAAAGDAAEGFYADLRDGII